MGGNAYCVCTLALQTAMQFKGKEQIGEFALGIGAKACVFPLPMQVAEIHAAASMGMLLTLTIRLPGVSNRRGSKAPVKAKWPK